MNLTAYVMVSLFIILSMSCLTTLYVYLKLSQRLEKDLSCSKEDVNKMLKSWVFEPQYEKQFKQLKLFAILCKISLIVLFIFVVFWQIHTYFYIRS